MIVKTSPVVSLQLWFSAMSPNLLHPDSCRDLGPGRARKRSSAAISDTRDRIRKVSQDVNRKISTISKNSILIKVWDIHNQHNHSITIQYISNVEYTKNIYTQP